MYLRFEKDLLNRAEEIQQSSKDVFVNVNKILKQNDDSETRECQSNYAYNNTTNESPTGGECLKYPE